MKIICFDVDMTLYDHGTRRIPESALRTLEELRRAGHKIFITTGRDMEDGYCRDILAAVRPDGMVHCNGGRVTADGTVLRDMSFDRPFVEKIFAFARENGITIGALDDVYGYCTCLEGCLPQVQGFFDGVGVTALPAEQLKTYPVHELFFFGSREKAALVEEAFPMLRLPMYASGNASDVIPRGISKAEGLKLVLDHYGLTFDDVIAVGDSNNDVELVRSAGIGIAMGNGGPEVRAAADLVTTDILDHGIYRAFRKLDMIPDLGY